MTNIILHGCNGRMGKAVMAAVNEDPSSQIVAGIDVLEASLPFPTYININKCTEGADVIIDFSNPKATPALLEFAKNRNIPLVLCTTGLSDSDMENVKKAAQSIAILKSANMSLGVNLIINLVKKATEILYDSNFDIEIIEKHHNQKIDAPSGTAMAIADAINESLDNSLEYVYDRTPLKEKRKKNQIGIHAIRGGTIVGEHEVIFAGKNEIVEISHRAMSREIFATGALKAAKFLSGKPAGFYTMNNIF
ncbi:MAG: 4-hydroxy-tetrahydrodipicolinate reductase [Lachnospiraceae bacterium]|nr:4-hydroxy-tetrahydrodipicolinate reductase [Lachnospiraceae bacterium]